MVVTYKCSFCEHEIPPGKGITYVKTDGTVYRFCSRRCRVNNLRFKRDPRRLKWTKKYVKGGTKKYGH